MALFREYIYRRFAGHDEGRIAQEAGLSVGALTFDSLGSIAYAPLIAKNKILSVARYRWRTPYISVDPWTSVWASELEGSQERTDIENQIDILIESGDMEHHAELLTLTVQGKDRRDRIEHDTDARYFREWPRGENLGRMGDDLAALIAALP